MAVAGVFEEVCQIRLEGETPMVQKSDPPGHVWVETKRIQNRGGSIFYEDGVFTWCGENKGHTTPGKRNLALGSACLHVH